MYQKAQNITIGKGVIAILIAGFISFILANTAVTSRYELGALINLLVSPFITVLAIIVFVSVCWITNSNLIRFTLLIIISIYLVYLGIGLHFEKESCPLIM